MKLVCPQRALAEGLAIVDRAVPTKSPLPVLSNVLLATEDGRLKLVGNNLEMAITAWVDGTNVVEEGSVTLPARLLSDFVSSLSAGEVSMELRPGTKTVKLKSGRYEANVNGVDADDFPAVPSVEGGGHCSVSARVLREAIVQAAFAAATDETRPVLSGVLVTIDGDRLTLAAADGFRLAVRTITLEEPADEAMSLLVPARTLKELARILEDSDKPVDIAATPNKNQIMFQYYGESKLGPKLLLVSRLIEGQFPDYQRIIPQGFQTRVVLRTDEFQRAAKTASVFSRDNSNIVRVSVTPGHDLVPGSVEVTATSAEMGDNLGQLDGSVEGEQVEIAFNVRYLAEALDAISGESVALEITGPTSPGLLKPATSADHLHVIMPMHVAR